MTFLKTSEALKLILVFGIFVIISCGYYMSKHGDWYTRTDVTVIDDSLKNKRELITVQVDDYLDEPTTTRYPPRPHPHSDKMVVLVMTRRSGTNTRDVIRETWAKGHDNVYFVIGKSCHIPAKHRKQWTCIAKDTPSPSEQASWEKEENQTETALAAEQSKHDDLLRVDEIDVYRHLPHKLKAAYQLALKNTQAE